MAPFKGDYKSNTNTRRIIYPVDGLSVQCRFVGNIEITIHKGNKLIETLKLDNVLIVPNLDHEGFSLLMLS